MDGNLVVTFGEIDFGENLRSPQDVCDVGDVGERVVVWLGDGIQPTVVPAWPVGSI